MTESFLRLIIYFDVFSYPLKKQELLSYAGINADQLDKAQKVLDTLVESGLVSFSDGYYFLVDSEKIVRRQEGNIRASKRMKSALIYSRIISWFPFVRAVMLSGSISKGYMDERDDIDYFIVVETGKLWIARTLLTLFKKIFLLNSYRNFCINYFVDTDNLYISEQNRFIATELVFLLPMYNGPLYMKLLSENAWVKKYYPIFCQTNNKCFEGNNFIKVAFEKIFQLKLFDKLEKWLLEKSVHYVRKKYTHLNKDTFNQCFVFHENEIRYLPNRQQFRIIDAYYQGIKNFEMQHGLQINVLEQSLNLV
jgi:hypothetical protein